MLGEQMRPVANPELAAIARGSQLTPPARYPGWPDGSASPITPISSPGLPRPSSARLRSQSRSASGGAAADKRGVPSPALTIRSTLTVRDPALRPTGSPGIRAGETLFLIGSY
jgi:hypothetical protein